MVVVSTLTVGTTYPTLAAAICGTWTVSRIFYTIGYGSGEPKRVSVVAFKRS